MGRLRSPQPDPDADANADAISGLRDGRESVSERADNRKENGVKRRAMLAGLIAGTFGRVRQSSAADELVTFDQAIAELVSRGDAIVQVVYGDDEGRLTIESGMELGWVGWMPLDSIISVRVTTTTERLRELGIEDVRTPTTERSID